jgi:hypothetical protein
MQAQFAVRFDDLWQRLAVSGIRGIIDNVSGVVRRRYEEALELIRAGQVQVEEGKGVRVKMGSIEASFWQCSCEEAEILRAHGDSGKVHLCGHQLAVVHGFFALREAKAALRKSLVQPN